jgi:adenylate cyclase
MTKEQQRVLVVDDERFNINVLVDLLKNEYKMMAAKDGAMALKAVGANPPDLILLDIMMPDMDGFEVIQQLKANPETASIPVIFLTAKTEAADETKGFELGAVDYIAKPFNPAVVQARVRTQLELILQRRKTEDLLEAILPKKVIKDLQTTGISKPDSFEDVTILFSDFVDFTENSAKMSPEALIGELSEIFSAFDEIIEKNNCERIKTIGDAYMAVCGMPEKDPEHAQNIINSALEFIEYLKKRNSSSQYRWENRMGINSGALVGGIVGTKKYIYDIFGDSVNLAARLEQNSEPLKILVSDSTYNLAKNNFSFGDAQNIELKGKGEVSVRFLDALQV